MQLLFSEILVQYITSRGSHPSPCLLSPRRSFIPSIPFLGHIFQGTLFIYNDWILQVLSESHDVEAAKALRNTKL